jgi:hypothetical protein
MQHLPKFGGAAQIGWRSAGRSRSEGTVNMRQVLLLSLVVLVVQGPSTQASDGKTLVVQGKNAAAILTAIDQAAPGDTVRLPAGTYPISKAICPRTGIRLIGAGQEQTILRYAGDTPSPMIRLADCEDVEISGLTLDGAENANATTGISASKARRLNLHHLTIKNLVKGPGGARHGIHFTGTNPTAARGVTDSEIADCLLEHIGVGTEFGGGIRLSWGSSRNRVLRNTIRHTGRGGIFGNDQSTDLVIRGNTVSGSGGVGLGIEVWHGCHRAVIEDNHLDHWLSLDGSDYSAVRHNVIRDRSGTFKPCGLELVGSSYCVLTDNTVDDGQETGISVSNQAPRNYVFWGFNTVQRSTQWGAQLQGESGGIAYHYFYRCQFLATSVGRGQPRYPGNDGRGFRTNGNVHHVTFEECEVRANERSGIQLSGSQVDFLSFVRCKIQGNRGAAVTGPASYTALEWNQCLVAGNGANDLPPARAFPSRPANARIVGAATAQVGKPVRFTAMSTAGQRPIRQVLWDFNDGIPATEAVATHTYSRAGEYRVTLLIWDMAGRGARTETWVKVSP